MTVKRLTLEEIGRLAGVSRSTVSRVINDQRDVSAEAKQRVLEVVESTGFRPNQVARSLVSNRTGVLGLVIPSRVHNLFNDPYFGRLIQGISRAANRSGQTVSLFLFEDADEEMEVYQRVIATGLVDGVIVTATRTGDRLVDRLVADGLPFVMVGRPDLDDIPHVDVDNRAGARAATEHLLGHGRERIATISAPMFTSAGVDRHKGYDDALRAAGLDIDSNLIAEGGFTTRGGEEAMRRLLPQRPDGVFCASDAMAVGALRAIAEAGLTCPDDIAVVGFDGLVESGATTPSLSSIAQPVPETGSAAVSLLLEVLDDGHPTPPRRELRTELQAAASCGCDP